MRIEYFGMSFPAFNIFQPRTFIFSSNEESALIVQGTGSKTDIALIQSSTENDLDVIYYISAENEVLNINKNSNLVVQFNYHTNYGSLTTDKVIAQTFSLSNTLNLTYSNDVFLMQENNTPFLTFVNNGSNVYAGIGKINPSYALDVNGDINSSGIIYGSNVISYGTGTNIIYGSTSNLNTVSIINPYTGPALYVNQLSYSNITEYYRNGTISFLINKDGYVGINTYTPNEYLDVNGNLVVSGSIGIGTDIGSNKLSVYGNSDFQGNIGIGTTYSSYGLHVYSDVAMGTGLLNTGPYYIQEGWDAASEEHSIPYPMYCVRDDSIGHINIHVKSTNSLKVGQLYVSFLKQSFSNVELFSIYKHKTNNLVTLDAQPNTSNIRVLTDNDCSISWIASGAC